MELIVEKLRRTRSRLKGTCMEAITKALIVFLESPEVMYKGFVVDAASSWQTLLFYLFCILGYAVFQYDPRTKQDEYYTI